MKSGLPLDSFNSYTTFYKNSHFDCRRNLFCDKAQKYKVSVCSQYLSAFQKKQYFKIARSTRNDTDRDFLPRQYLDFLQDHQERIFYEKKRVMNIVKTILKI